jgi:hypothetical protein
MGENGVLGSSLYFAFCGLVKKRATLIGFFLILSGMPSYTLGQPSHELTADDEGHPRSAVLNLDQELPYDPIKGFPIERLLAGVQERWKGLLGLKKTPPLAAVEGLEDIRDFVSRKNIVFEVGTPAAGAIAEYGDGKVVINQDMLALDFVGTRGAMTERQTFDMIALRWFPTIVHELQHGVTREKVKTKIGIECPHLLETETISFLRQIGVFKKLKEIYPQMSQRLMSTDSQMSAMMATWDKEKLKGIRDTVAQMYQIPSVRDPVEKVREWYAEKVQKGEEWVNSLSAEDQQAIKARIEKVKSDLADFRTDLANISNPSLMRGLETALTTMEREAVSGISSK